MCGLLDRGEHWVGEDRRVVRRVDSGKHCACHCDVDDLVDTCGCIVEGSGQVRRIGIHIVAIEGIDTRANRLMLGSGLRPVKP